jgi:hypothetical protein
VEKVKNQRVVSLAGLPKCPFSHLFSMPSLIAQAEGYFGKHFTLIFSHIGVGYHNYSKRNGQLVTMCTDPSIK